MSDEVYVVFEDSVGTVAHILRVFDNERAAKAYVTDPDQPGELFIANCDVEQAYSP